jgi:hypothetical protein
LAKLEDVDLKHVLEVTIRRRGGSCEQDDIEEGAKGM